RFPLTEFIERHVTKYPTPKNLNYLWNFGSLAGAFLVIQIVTGVWLTMYYKADTRFAFDSIEHIMRDVNYGWIIRYLHAIGPAGFFFAIYIHMARGLYYGSYKSPRELLWWIGLLIYLALMAEAFMGYLLPWGQMSYWGATVITNLYSAIPFVGPDLVIWLRGDFAVGDATLGRFFSLHVALIPIAVIGGLVVMHLIALHKVGSNNPEGIDLGKNGPGVIPFAPYFITKDFWFTSLVFTVFFYFVFFRPDFFLEPLNSEPANPFVTPLHIVPEWYYLPFYAILRSIPHKLGGVIAMGGAIFILAFLPYLDRSPVRSARYRPVKKILTWLFFVNFIILGYVGMLPPFGAALWIGRIATAYYFLYFILLPLIPFFEKTKPLPLESEV
ncbi:MAG: cytochrome b N-terminal domain-containing protein, partial [Deltaproteobacteria bacterium]